MGTSEQISKVSSGEVGSLCELVQGLVTLHDFLCSITKEQFYRLWRAIIRLIICGVFNPGCILRPLTEVRLYF